MASDSAPPITLRTPAFVGRAREMAALDAALVHAREGTGAIALLVGEPGIGKTRLVEEFTRRAAAAGAEILTGRSFEGPGAPAFWPWTQVVRAYVAARDAPTLAAELGTDGAIVAAIAPELGPVLSPNGTAAAITDDRARFRLFDTLAQALRRSATRRPLVVVLEDLHGADRDSLLLLQFLARELRRTGLLIVATLRGIASVPEHPMLATLGALVRERVAAELTLEGLSASEVAELMADLGDAPPPGPLARAVHALTEGNPLYVAEIVRELAAHPAGFAVDPATLAIPLTVRSTIARHLDTLSPAARETLTIAALFGREFRLEVVARTAGAPAEDVLRAIDEGTAARLVGRLAGLPGRYRFLHALFAETLVDALSERRRHELHRAAAMALAASPDLSAVVPEIAHHWWAAGIAGDPASAVAWTRRAGDRAAAMLAHEDAMRWYRHGLEALGWLGSDDHALRAELLLGFGEAAKRAGAVDDAKRAFEDAIALGRTLGSAEIQTRGALGYAPTLTWAEQPAPDPVVTGHLEEAIAAWNGRDSPWHARALARLGLAHVFGDRERRIDAVARGVEMARRVDDKGALRYALATSVHLYDTEHDLAGRLETANELVRLGDEARDLESLAVGRRWRAVLLFQHGDLAGFEAERLALKRIADQLREPAWVWWAAHPDVLRLALAGRFAEAEQVLIEVSETVRPTMPFAAYAHVVASRLYFWLWRGGDDACVDEYRAAFGMHPEPAAATPLACAEALRGRHEEAAAIVTRLLGGPLRFGSVDILTISVTMLAEACAVIGDRDGAVRLFDVLRPFERYWMTWAETLPLGTAAHTLGLLARTAGRPEEAVPLFERAIVESRRLGARPYLARALVEQAATLRERRADGDAERSTALLAEARPIAVELGLAPLAARIAELAGGDTVEEERTPVPPAHRAPDATPRASAATTVPSPAAGALCRREGDYWTLAWSGHTIRMRDTRGMAYLAHLLWHPGRDFHATELVDLVAGRPPDPAGVDPDARVAKSLGDAGSALDARASSAYRHRLIELRDELAEAERHHDLGRAAALRAELDAVAHELRAGGRGQRAAAHDERARVAVTKGIGAALARIRAAHPALARHLEATVRRGYSCSYVPDPRHPIAWER